MVASVRVAPSFAAPASWRLVGPWYRWPHPGLPKDGRISRPAIQKFAGDSFIQDFLERPQHSLKYDEIIDVVNNYDLVSATSAMAGKIGSILTLNAKGEPAMTGNLFRARLAPSTLRKLYQPTHDRHYLVTLELHCDEPGFPRVARNKVCQAGFVVRRRRSKLPAGMSADTVTAQAKTVQTMEADLLELLALDTAATDPLASAQLVANAQAEQQKQAQNAGEPNWEELLAARRSDLEIERKALHEWYGDNGISVEIDGWFPTVQDGRISRIYGAWIALDPAAQIADITSGEQTYPMFPLVPDPRDTGHDAAGRTLYYGVIPTTGLQHDQNALARFDDLTTYEVRCFVREHHFCQSRTGKSPDCLGPVVWSLPTQAFRVAAPFDLLGASNRPITIKMPDLRELAAQAAMRPRGRLSPIRFVQPQHLSPKISGDAVDGGEMGGEAICSFSIPLITIIAMFVLTLFLPIVVFIFNLWFLLVFRFCIPPQMSIDLGLDVALAVTPPSLDLDVDLAVKVSGVDKLASELGSLFNTSMKTRIKEDTGYDEDPDIDALSNNAIGPIAQSVADAAALKANPDGSLPAPPPVGTPLEYEDPVTPVWPAAGAAT